MIELAYVIGSLIPTLCALIITKYSVFVIMSTSFIYGFCIYITILLINHEYLVYVFTTFTYVI